MALLASIVLPAPAAVAPPRPVATIPVDDSTIAAAPAWVEVAFLEPVSAALLSLIAQDGAVTPLAAAVDPADRRRVSAPLPPGLRPGVWTIGWSVPDEQGRPVAGTFAFRVGAGAPAGAAVAAGRWPSAWAVATRWLTLLGLGLAAGVAVSALVGLRRGEPTVAGAWAGAAAVGATLAAVTTAIEPVLARQAAPGEMPRSLADAVAGMPAGWPLRLTAALLSALLWLGWIASGRTGTPVPASFAATGAGFAVGALAALGWSGSAARSAGPLQPLGTLADVLATAAIGLLIGGLVVVAFGRAPAAEAIPNLAASPEPERSTPRRAGAAARLLPAAPVLPATSSRPGPALATGFAPVLLPAAIVALVAGTLAAALTLPDAASIRSTAPGWLLLLDGLLLLGALLLAGRFSRRTGTGPLKVAALLALVASLGAATTPLLATPDAETLPTLARLDLAAAVPLPGDTVGTVNLALAPGAPGANGIVVALAQADGTVLPPAGAPLLELSFRPLDHPGGAQTVALLPDRFGGWATGAAILEDAGWWQADALFVAKDGQADRIPFWFVLPDPNATGRGPLPAADPAARAVFDRARARLATLRSVRYTQRLSDGSGSLYQSVLAVTDAVGGRPAAFEEHSRAGSQVVVGDTRWIRRAGDPGWTEQAAPSLSLPSAWAATYADAGGFRLGPVEEIAGEPCRVVTFSLRRGPQSAPTWFAWWVGEETGWIRREAMVSTRHYMVYTFSDFNADIRIEPPDAPQGPAAGQVLECL